MANKLDATAETQKEALKLVISDPKNVIAGGHGVVLTTGIRFLS